eukprot:Gb_38150 [translate_table: standard]
MHAISTQIVDDNITRNLTIGVSRKLKFKPFGEELGHELPSVATGEDLYTLKIIMPLKSIFQDMKGGIGSISKRNFEVKFHRSRSQSALDDSHYKNNNKNNKNHGVLQESLWGNMPPELLRDVIQRIEGSESSWPCRKHVVACAGVCRTWRQITKELVKTPEISEKLTFPISLKQSLQRKVGRALPLGHSPASGTNQSATPLLQAPRRDKSGSPTLRLSIAPACDHPLDGLSPLVLAMKSCVCRSAWELASSLVAFLYTVILKICICNTSVLLPRRGFGYIEVYNSGCNLNYYGLEMMLQLGAQLLCPPKKELVSETSHSSPEILKMLLLASGVVPKCISTSQPLSAWIKGFSCAMFYQARQGYIDLSTVSELDPKRLGLFLVRGHGAAVQFSVQLPENMMLWLLQHGIRPCFDFVMDLPKYFQDNTGQHCLYRHCMDDWSLEFRSSTLLSSPSVKASLRCFVSLRKSAAKQCERPK